MWGSDEAFRVYGLPLTPGGQLPLAQVQAIPLPEFRPVLDRALADLLAGTAPYDVRFRIRRPDDGRVRIIQSFAEAARDPLGRPLLVSGTLQDITEPEERAEALLAAVRASEERAVRAFEQAADAILLFDAAGIVVGANAKAVALTGYGRDELVGQDLRRLFSPAALEARPLQFQRVLEGETVVTARPITRKDGRRVEVEMSTSRLSDGTVQTIVRDVSERRRLEAQLQLRQRMDSLGTLVGGIAHDFNNILAAIMGWADVLRVEGDGLGAPQREALDAILQSTRRGADLVRGLQFLSHPEPPGQDRFDLAVVATEVVNVLRETTDRLVTKVQAVPAGRHAVRGSASGLYHALMNLGLNAVQAVEELGAGAAGEVRFEAEPHQAVPGGRLGLAPGAWVHLRVIDTGAGMTEEVRGQVFDPLFTTKEKGARKGQGLGLAMVFNCVVVQHGGAIEVESASGRGSTFHLYLPAADGVSAATAAGPAPGPPAGRGTILVVDDEPLIVSLTRRTLQRAGYEVLSAGDGLEAVALFEARAAGVDLVLLDRTLPRLRGEQVLERLRALRPDVKVIVSSGDAGGAREAFPGVQAILQKPYTPTELGGLIAAVLADPGPAAGPTGPPPP
jgi:PAS domain S-box-containing protein